jgi:LPXTG-motif cell wall-anchored protein
MRPSSALRAGRRALAALGAAALGALALPLPAAAQAPVPVDVGFDFPSPIDTGMGTPNTGVIDVAFGDDFEPGVHELTATLTVDLGSFDFMFVDPDGACAQNDDEAQLVCTVPEADANERFDFQYGAYIRVYTGVYDYTLEIAVDGETVETLDGEIEIIGDPRPPLNPYHYGDVAVEGAAPGSTVEVAPEFLQVDPLRDDVAAVVVTFTHPQLIPSGTRAVADYDNCVPDRLPTNGAEGISCIVTDFEDLPGAVFTFATPVAYPIDEDAPGPIAVCGCSYVVYAAGADWIEEELGGITWDEDSDDLFGLRTVSDPESAFDANTGTIWIGTAANPYDLAVDSLHIDGDRGEAVALTATVANEGPAAAYEFFGDPGAYALLVDLPPGVEPRGLDGSCVEEGDWDGWATRLPGVDPDGFDFACFFPSLGSGETLDIGFDVEVADPDANGTGRLEVVALDDDGYPGVADADPANNRAAVTVDGGGRLPATGPSLTLVLGAAAAALAAGALLYARGRRRDTTASTEE